MRPYTRDSVKLITLKTLRYSDRGCCESVSLGGRQAAHLAVDDGGEAEEVEDLGAVAPHGVAAVLPETLLVEAVHLRDLPRLVVASDQRDAVRVTHLRRRGGGGGVSRRGGVSGETGDA